MTRLKHQEHELQSKLFKFEQRFEHDTSLSRTWELAEYEFAKIVKTKEALLKEKKQVQDTMEELRKDLHEQESENEKLRTTYLQKKEQQEHSLQNELYNQDTSARYFKSKRTEIQDLQALMHKLGQLHEEIESDTVLRRHIFKSFDAGVHNLITAVQNQYVEQNNAMYRELQMVADEFIAEYQTFGSIDSTVESLSVTTLSQFHDLKFDAGQEKSIQGMQTALQQLKLIEPNDTNAEVVAGHRKLLITHTLELISILQICKFQML